MTTYKKKLGGELSAYFKFGREPSGEETVWERTARGELVRER
jgi:hypothetical protein